MKVVALISWYDERPEWLAAGVASMAPFADEVVALDGAYFLYPEGNPRSPRGQAEAIRETARACRMGCTIHEPVRTWAGNEVEKRSALFAFGEQVCDPEDWYFVLDGDEVVSDGAGDVKDLIAGTELDCAEVMMWKARDHARPDERPFVTAFEEQNKIRVAFRAIRGLRVEENHYTYVTPDRRQLWGKGPLEEAADFTHVRIEHRNKDRDLWRADQAMRYYKRRDELNIEGLIP